MLWCKATLDSLGYPNGEISGEDFYVDHPSGERVHYEAYIQLRMAVRQHIQSGARPELRELKAPPKYSNYKRSSQYEQALWDVGIDVNALDAAGAYIVREDGLPFTKDQLEEDMDFKNINIKANLEFPN